MIRFLAQKPTSKQNIQKFNFLRTKLKLEAELPHPVLQVIYRNAVYFGKLWSCI